MDPDKVDEEQMSSSEHDNLDLDAAIGAAEDLLGDDARMEVDLDEVLNAESDAEDHLAGPRLYDFNRPHNISRAFEQNLQAVGEAFAKVGTIDFTSLLRMSMQVDFKGLNQQTYGEYITQMEQPTCVSLVTLAPLKGNIIIHLDLGLCFIFMKKLMGGAPSPEDTVREFTEIERGINAGLVNRFTEILRKAASKLIPLEPRFVSLENNPNYLGGVADGENLIILKFKVMLDAVESPVEIAFPLSAFSPVKDVFDPQESLDLRTPEEMRQDRRRILEMVRGTGSELVVQLGDLDTNLEEIMKLQEGDVLHLPQAVEAPLKVKIEGEDAWLGEAGRLGQNRAVKLISKLTKE